MRKKKPILLTSNLWGKVPFESTYSFYFRPWVPRWATRFIARRMMLTTAQWASSTAQSGSVEQERR